jgi:hypothetical protein
LVDDLRVSVSANEVEGVRSVQVRILGTIDVLGPLPVPVPIDTRARATTEGTVE